MESRKKMLIWDKRDGSSYEIWADRFNPDFHSEEEISPSGEVIQDLEENIPEAEESAEEVNPEEDEVKVFTCDECGKTFKTEPALKAHKTRYHAK